MKTAACFVIIVAGGQFSPADASIGEI